MNQKQALYLALSILFGCIASGNLKETYGFTKFIPSLISSVSCVLCMFFLSKVMESLSIGVVYATYSALAVTIITLIGVFIYKQIPNCYSVLGFILIVSGMILIHTIGSIK